MRFCGVREWISAINTVRTSRQLVFEIPMCTYVSNTSGRKRWLAISNEIFCVTRGVPVR